MYSYELHCHTAGVSKCASATPEEGAAAYFAAGYAGVVVTNHFNHYTCEDVLPEDASWDQVVDFYLEGYRRFKKAAEGKLEVFLGMEIRFDENWNDYLVFGVTEEFLRSHPEIINMTAGEFSVLSRQEGLLFYQAHPFRNGMTVTDPKLLDGIESYNGHLNHDSRNDIAMMWAEKHHLLQSSGSDYHDPGREARGGILVPERIRTQEELLKVLRSQPLLIRK